MARFKQLPWEKLLTNLVIIYFEIGLIFAILFAILIAFYYVGLLDFNTILSSGWGQTMVEVLKKANLFLSLPLIIDLIILGFVKLSIKKIR